jgi:hypothetical protein
LDAVQAEMAALRQEKRNLLDAWQKKFEEDRAVLLQEITDLKGEEKYLIKILKALK